MTALDTGIVIAIVLFLILIIWSRIMGQRMLDTLNEILVFVREVKKPVE